MRALSWLVLLPMLLSVHAQAAPSDLIVHLSTPTHEVAPLTESMSLAYWVNLSCISTPPSTQGSVIRTQASGPAWAQLAVQPSAFSFTVSSCADAPNGIASFNGSVSVKATQDAPAHTAEHIVLNASLDAAGANATGQDSVQFTAAYHSVLDARADKTEATIAPGEAASFRVNVTNHGNAATLVRIQPSVQALGIHVDDISDLMLESAQQGRAPNSGEVNVTIRAAPDADAQQTIVTLRVNALEASGGRHGDSATLSFVVKVVGSKVAAPGVLLALVALGIAATRRRG